MKAWWKKLATRIDALSLRERAILFVSILAMCVAAADTFWLSPAQVVHQTIRQSSVEQGTDLLRLRDELKSLAQPVDASKTVRSDIASANAQLEAINQDIAVRVPTADSGPALEQVLVQFLKRQEGLILLGISTASTVPEGTATAASTAAAPVGMVKRGLELRVAGPYSELVHYVRTLENTLPALRWGALHLKSEKQPPELTLQVYVVGAQP